MADVTTPGEWAGLSSMRDQNRRAVMELILRQSETTRRGLGLRTGLSRSTISRVVDELLGAGFLEEVDRAERMGRGRPSRALRVAHARGLVVGVDVGVAWTRMIASDLNGFQLRRDLQDTPAELDGVELARWLAARILEIADDGSRSPLRGVVVSFPAKIDGDVTIRHPSKRLAQLAGETVYAHLSRLVPAPLVFRSDPDMALRGEMLSGSAVDEPNVVLFIVSAAVEASVVIEGAQLGGDRVVLGEFGRMPYAGGERRLDDVLTIDALLAGAGRQGVGVADVSGLIDAMDDPRLADLRADFVSGLVQMLTATTLTIEPSLVVFAGRLLPLIELVLEDVKAGLRELLPVQPRIALSESHGYSQPLGAVQVALDQVRPVFLDEIATFFGEQ